MTDEPQEQLSMFRDALVAGARTRKAVAGFVRGQQGRDSGVERVWDATDDDWKQHALAIVGQFAKTGMPFTAEDVRELVGDPPGHPNAFGALFQRAARAGLIRKIGFTKATRKSLHAHPIGEWVGVGTAA